MWLCQYLQLMYVIYDNGTEFKWHLIALCSQFGIECNPTTMKNSQMNAM